MKKWKNLKIKKKIMLIFIGFWLIYLSFGYLFHLVIFPEKIPKITTYFQSEDNFKSDFEGFSQTVD